MLNEIKEIVTGVTDEETTKALERMKKILKPVKMPNHLNHLLFSIGQQTWKGTGGSGKIPCQPTSVSRRDPG